MKLSWKTVHDTSAHTMTHSFENKRLCFFTDLKTGLSYIQKDGKSIDVIDITKMSTEQYLWHLNRLAEEAEKLETFKNYEPCAY